jgi:integrase
MTNNKADISDETKKLADKIKDKGTREASDIAKAGDLEYFWAWAELAHPITESYPIPWEVILNFIVTHLEGKLPKEVEKILVAKGVKRKPGRHKLKTVKRRVSSLSWKHKEMGFQGVKNSTRHHDITEVLKKAANDSKHRSKPSKAVGKNTLKEVLSTIDDKAIDIRDKALIALTWASGRRRSESNGLCIEDITEKKADYYIFELTMLKNSSSADDTLKFKVAGIAKTHLDNWLYVSKITAGPIFRRVYKNGRVGQNGLTDTQVYRIVKKRFSEAGIDNWESITPHSLRSGFVTELGKQGGNVGDGMALTGHKSLDTFMSYYQSGEAETNTAANLLDD